MSHFLQFSPAPYKMTNNLIPRSHLYSLKTLYSLIYSQLPIKHVPRHSYNLVNFVPGRQKMRHASFIPTGTGTLPRYGFSAPASIHSATQTPFIAGPLAVKNALPMKEFIKYVFTGILAIILFSCNSPKKINDSADLNKYHEYISETFQNSPFKIKYFGTAGKLVDIDNDEITNVLNGKVRFNSDLVVDDKPYMVYCGEKKLSLVFDTTQIVSFDDPILITDFNKYTGTDTITVFLGYPLYIINKNFLSKFTVTKGVGYGIIIEAKDPEGKWQPISYLSHAFGWPLSYDYILNPRDYLVAILPKYSGDFQTQLRIKLKTQCGDFYSNSINSNISVKQFIIPDSITNNTNRDIVFSF